MGSWVRERLLWPAEKRRFRLARRAPARQHAGDVEVVEEDVEELVDLVAIVDPRGAGRGPSRCSARLALLIPAGSSADANHNPRLRGRAGQGAWTCLDMLGHRILTSSACYW